ncbi:glycosyltransferase family 2 protein [Actinotalea ferrariae]|uniref:glycosyltransferase n=1 Tax=Actinotalea ferrariae TaxID=1386098 RepID=UPI001C8C811D|nr:glycosyltransferase [Actinotalea ferrariae]MBX9245011.1 glycosyltransferase family 2 protein [Actinotalea ferrariae]
MDTHEPGGDQRRTRGSGPLRVRIAIPTFHRPEGLRDALDGVLEQVAALSPSLAEVTVMVVDNDAQGSGRATSEARGVLYVVEPQPGIAAVRNRSLGEAADQDAIIFLDDDEVPCPGWLETLVGRFVESGAEGVAGKVLTPFPDDVPEWIRVSGAFVRPVRTDGEPMTEAATNNLILDLHAVRRSGITFDERFGLSGGSDSLFTRSFTRWGARLVWAEHAVVVEREDPERFNRAWVLQRTFRLGNSLSRVNVTLARTAPERALVRARMTAVGTLRMASGGARIVWGRATGSLAQRGRGERTASRGRGMVAGALGHVHREYALRREAMARPEP